MPGVGWGRACLGWVEGVGDGRHRSLGILGLLDLAASSTELDTGGWKQGWSSTRKHGDPAGA